MVDIIKLDDGVYMFGPCDSDVMNTEELEEYLRNNKNFEKFLKAIENMKKG